MMRTTNARIAGTALLLYIAVGIAQMVVFGGTTTGDGTAARLASMAQLTQLMWIPMTAFEIPLGLWLLVKGVAHPANSREQAPRYT